VLPPFGNPVPASVNSVLHHCGNQLPASVAPVLSPFDNPAPASVKPVCPQYDNQLPASVAPVLPPFDNPASVSVKPVFPQYDKQLPASVAPVLSPFDNPAPASVKPVRPSSFMPTNQLTVGTNTHRFVGRGRGRRSETQTSSVFNPGSSATFVAETNRNNDVCQVVSIEDDLNEIYKSDEECSDPVSQSLEGLNPVPVASAKPFPFATFPRYMPPQSSIDYCNPAASGMVGLFHLAPQVSCGSELTESVLRENPVMTDNVMALILRQYPELAAKPVDLRYLVFREIMIMKNMLMPSPGLSSVNVNASISPVGLYGSHSAITVSSQSAANMNASVPPGLSGINTAVTGSFETNVSSRSVEECTHGSSVNFDLRAANNIRSGSSYVKPSSHVDMPTSTVTCERSQLSRRTPTAENMETSDTQEQCRRSIRESSPVTHKASSVVPRVRQAPNGVAALQSMLKKSSLASSALQTELKARRDIPCRTLEASYSSVVSGATGSSSQSTSCLNEMRGLGNFDSLDQFDNFSMATTSGNMSMKRRESPSMLSGI